jgi:hypothetical protein
MGNAVAAGQKHLMCVLIFAALLLPSSAAFAATSAEIQASIDKGKAYLYSIQSGGNWEIVPAPDPKHTNPWEVENTQYGGLTAIATFALLAAGEDPQDPRIKQAVAFLEKTGSPGTYAIGVRCQIWNMVPQDEVVKVAMARDRALLVQGIAGKAPNTGFYGYDCTKPGSDADHSASQFGVLGMWALNQAGMEVPSDVWRAYDFGWRSQQLAPGAWSYRFTSAVTTDAAYLPSLSMTNAGVATLFITQEYTRAAPRLAGNVDDPAIDAGVKWIGEHLTDLTDDRRYYTLFGISRVGMACGYKYIGSTDWFRWGADQIVKEQHPEGFWASLRENPHNVPDTSFALLFSEPGPRAGDDEQAGLRCRGAGRKSGARGVEPAPAGCCQPHPHGRQAD